MEKANEMTIITRDCGSKDFCSQFVCKNNYYCKCKYCSTDKCNNSPVRLTKPGYFNILALTFLLVIFIRS